MSLTKRVEKMNERIENMNSESEFVDLNSNELKEWLGLMGKMSTDVTGDVIYFICLRMISESIGKLPFHLRRSTRRGKRRIHNHPVLNLLRTRPNPYITPSVFWSTVEANRLHHGNAYVFINRDPRGNIKDLWIMASESVKIIIDDVGIFKSDDKMWYEFTDPKTGKKHLYHHSQVMHFKTSYSFDGILGISVRDKLGDMLKGNKASQDLMGQMYEKGLTARAVLQYTGDLDAKAQKRLTKGIERFATGKENAGRIIPIPLGMQLTPLDIKLTDAQFLELRKLSALQVAAAFGVKPTQINDYEKSSYDSAEMQNIAFLTDTLLYIVKQYEEEIGFKMLSDDELAQGFAFRMNIDVVLRTDQKTQAEVLQAYVNNSIKKPNEARDDLGLEADDNGDRLIANGNYIPLDMVGKQYEK